MTKLKTLCVDCHMCGSRDSTYACEGVSPEARLTCLFADGEGDCMFFSPGTRSCNSGDARRYSSCAPPAEKAVVRAKRELALAQRAEEAAEAVVRAAAAERAGALTALCTAQQQLKEASRTPVLADVMIVGPLTIGLAVHAATPALPPPDHGGPMTWWTVETPNFRWRYRGTWTPGSGKPLSMFLQDVRDAAEAKGLRVDEQSIKAGLEGVARSLRAMLDAVAAM